MISLRTKAASLLILLGLALLIIGGPDTRSTSPTAPGFSLRSLDDSVVRLADYRGKIALISFWATWCGPCRDEMPMLERAYNEFAGRLDVIGINMREDEATIRDFVRRHHLTFPILVQPDDSLLLNYNVRGLPITVIVGPDGAILKRVDGPLDWDTVSRVVR